MENLEEKLLEYIKNSEDEVLKANGISGVEIYKLKKEKFILLKNEYLEDILNKMKSFKNTKI